MAKNRVALLCDMTELSGLFERSKSVDDFLNTAVGTIAYHMKSAVCSIYLYDEEHKELVLKANQGLGEKAIGLRLKISEGITGKAFTSTRPISEGQAANNPDFKYIEGIDEEQYQAFLAVPIMRSLQPLGVLVVQDPQSFYFDGNDIRALKAISTQLASTIESAKLLIDLHEQQTHEEVGEYARYAKGKSASEGIGIGQAFVQNAEEFDVLTAADDEEDDCALERFQQALDAAEVQLEELQAKLEENLSDVASLIFSAHLLILKDQEFSGAMEKWIKHGMGAQRAVTYVVNDYINLFSKSKNPVLREKVQDLKDLGHRLLNNLMNKNQDTQGDYKGQIVVTSDLMPSDVVKLMAQQVEALVVVHGGITSHIAILARSLGIPLVYVSEGSFLNIPDGVTLLVDANQGSVFVDPDEEILKNYNHTIKRNAWQEDAATVKDKTITRDGTPVSLLANINLLNDLEVAKQMKADGVGLYRSEFPFLVRASFPSEEEQFQVYRQIVKGLDGREVVLRTLDVGGDKHMTHHDFDHKESNPFLGLRAIRFSLKNPDIFATQLRAMLRAFHDQPRAKIMFPMICSVDEYRRGRAIVEECMISLQEEQIPYHTHPEIGGDD